jgi:hypothetical protein
MSILRFIYILLPFCSWWKDHLLRLTSTLVAQETPLNKKNFIKNTMVTKELPKRLNAAEIYLLLNEKGDKYKGFEVDHSCTHICGLWELPYMSSLILVHNIDAMHQESNVVEALIHTCMHFEKNKGQYESSKRSSNIYPRGRPRPPTNIYPRPDRGRLDPRLD